MPTLRWTKGAATPSGPNLVAMASQASVWESQDALDRFARSDPHRRPISSIQPLMAPTTFTFWDQPSTEVPVQWTSPAKN
jgi:hypothetical protein